MARKLFFPAMCSVWRQTVNVKFQTSALAKALWHLLKSHYSFMRVIIMIFLEICLRLASYFTSYKGLYAFTLCGVVLTLLIHWQDYSPHLIIAPNAGVAAYMSWLPTIVSIFMRWFVKGDRESYVPIHVVFFSLAFCIKKLNNMQHY